MSGRLGAALALVARLRAASSLLSWLSVPPVVPRAVELDEGTDLDADGLSDRLNQEGKPCLAFHPFNYAFYADERSINNSGSSW